jgi:hypothetical protein
MVVMLSSLVLAASLVVTGPIQDPAPGVVRGVVRSESTRQPLKYAVVEVVRGDLKQRAVTDSSGVYVLRRVPNGLHTVRAVHLDHAPFEVDVLVPGGSEVRVDMTLALRPVAMPPIVARTRMPRGSDTIAAAQPDLGAAAVRALEASPGVAELGMGGAHSGVPGSEPGDPSDVLYVRGAAADLKLVLLDGAPVYAPFHVGGLINAFDPEVLRSATLYLGGAPARYDGGLSYVMDMQTRAGRRDSPRTHGAIDLLSARGLVEGPITSNAAYLVSGRTVHGLGAAQLLNDAFPYTYGDALGRVDLDLGVHGALRATGFWNQESVALDYTERVGTTARWGNTAGSLSYRGLIAGAEADFTAGYGSFEARLPIGGVRPLTANGLAERIRMAADLGHGLGFMNVHYGASYDHIALHYIAHTRGGERLPPVSETEASGDVAGAYFDATAQAGKRVRLRAGVRTDLFSHELLAPRFGPRLAATWLVSDRVALTLAAGRYHQYVRAAEVAVLAVDPLAADEQAIAPLTVASASHLLLALDQDLGEGIRLGLQGFFKTYEGLPGEAAVRDAINHASGLDLWVRRSTGRLTGWLGYSLGWAWSVTPLEPEEDRFAGRQLISAGLTGRIGVRGRFDLRLGYGAGLPYTAIPESDGTSPAFTGAPVGSIVPAPTAGMDAPPITTTPTDPYFRVDAEVAHTFATQWWSFAFEITPYVRIINALARRDALFYHFDRGTDTEPRALATLPVLPVVGMEWRF